MPETSFGMPTTVFSASAIEFGCVNGVVVSAATAATSANSPREARRPQSVAQVVHRPGQHGAGRGVSRNVTPSTASPNLIAVATKP